MPGVVVRLAVLLVLVATMLVGAAGGVVQAKPGSSEAARLCQDGGFAELRGTDGTVFKNTGECVAFAARGGIFAYATACVVTATTGCFAVEDVTTR